jgi:DNA-binding transcriptional MocR family regulator
MPGARLPSSRTLAADLGVARNTGARAYSEIVAEGWLTSAHGSRNNSFATCGRSRPVRDGRSNDTESALPRSRPAARSPQIYRPSPGKSGAVPSSERWRSTLRKRWAVCC